MVPGKSNWKWHRSLHNVIDRFALNVETA